MKKKIVLILLASFTALGALTGCSDYEAEQSGHTTTAAAATAEEAPTDVNAASSEAASVPSTSVGTSNDESGENSRSGYMAGLNPLDYVKLEDYKGFTVEVDPPDSVSEDDVEEEINQYFRSQDTSEMTADPVDSSSTSDRKEPDMDITDDIVAGENIYDNYGNKITTVSDLKAYVRSQLESQAYSDYSSRLDTAVVQHLLDNNEINPPQSLVNRFIQSNGELIKITEDRYGMTFQEVIELIGFEDEEDYLSAIKKQSEEDARIDLILNAIAEKENIRLSEYEIEDAIRNKASSYGYTSSEEFSDAVENDPSYHEQMKEQYIVTWVKRTVTAVSPETD